MANIIHRQGRKGRKGLVFFALFASFAVGLSLTYTALAQNGEPTDDEVNAVAKQLYCPVCENIPLDVCPTEACIQWRADIREKLAAGWTEDQIKASFAERFGDRVLAQPPTSGLNILVWVLPPLGLAAGAFFLVRYLRSSTSAQSAPALSGPPVAHDEFERQLEEELAKRR